LRPKSFWLLSGLLLCSVAGIPAGAQEGATLNLNPIGKSAPIFTAKALDGKEVSLADYRGKTVLVTFWATGCRVCRRQLPLLAELRKRYAAQGFEVLGIVTDDAANDQVRRIAARYGVKYPILRCNSKTAQAYGGLSYLPASFYIGRNGKVILEAAGVFSKNEIEADIQTTLKLGAN